MISEDKQIAMFGTKIYVLDDVIAESHDPLMLSMQMLSDAQEAMSNDPEIARQYINRAKHAIDSVRHKKL